MLRSIILMGQRILHFQLNRNMNTTTMTPKTALWHLSICFVIVLLPSCAKSSKPPIEDLSGRENLRSFTLKQIRGTRNGDRLDAEAKFGDGSSTVTVEM